MHSTEEDLLYKHTYSYQQKAGGSFRYMLNIKETDTFNH